MHNAFPIVVSAPSGAGKTSICRRLLRRNRRLVSSVSWTTREPRKGEIDGRHYVFVDEGTFKERAQGNGFLETAFVHGHYYGTPRAAVDQHLRHGQLVLMAIDVQGGASIAAKVPGTVKIFILPPSWEVLRQRLERRKDPAETVATRLKNARAELDRAKEYDYLVVNDRLQSAVEQVESIIEAESLRTVRNRGLLSSFQ